ncbi:MAG TPA: hypothetical protein VF881_02580, partial [Polyangiaceae bacterium]
MTCDRRRSLVVVLFCLGAGCGGSAGPVPLLWLGKNGVHLPASTAANVFWVDLGIDGRETAPVVVDTGAPIALLHPEAFHGAVPKGSGRVAAMSLGGTILWKVPTVGITGDDSFAPNGQRFGGIIG